MFKCVLFIAAISLVALQKSVANSDLYQRQNMKAEISHIANIYKIAYAPSEWKNKVINWNIDSELQLALDKIDAKSDLSVKEYQYILRDFFRSTQDYHVGYSFHSTESARLHFSVKSAAGKYFISYIDREKLSELAFPFEVGDEILEFDGQPVRQVVTELAQQHGMGVPGTDMAIAELQLTSRAASRGMVVPRGSVELKIRVAHTGLVRDIQLMWSYTPESIFYPSVTASQKFLPMKSKTQSVVSKIKSTSLELTGWKQMFNEDSEDSEDRKKPLNPFLIGGKQSFVPKLGTLIWKADESIHYHAYIYKNGLGQLIGYIRIPHYGGGNTEFQQFKQIIAKFEEVTDAMVIDQINNPGGSLFYIYALNSVLSDKVTYTPKGQIQIYPAVVSETQLLLRQLEKVDNEDQARKLLGEEWGGYPVTYQTAIYLREFSQFLISEWNKGKTLSDPIHQWGVDKVNPDKDVNFTKPIVVLTNELDFSGGDFFPAILQDNKRATVLGTRTAGAGGFVLGTSVTSAFGLDFFTFTGSLAHRINGDPIENLGVTPDIHYELTENDFQNNFIEYGTAINSAIQKLIEGSK